jgi:hypothetical protein
MLELTFIIYFLLIFVFPIELAAITLGLVTTWKCYQQIQLCNHQPPEGKKVLLLKAITTACNLILGIIVSLAMAFMIHNLIFTHWILFAFNFVFSLIISLRWFDFTHLITRHYIIKFGAHFDKESWAFVEIIGLKTRSGRWSGFTPVFMDAGGLRWQNSELIFDGVFYKQKFSSQNSIQVEKKSLDQIKISLKYKQGSKPDICIISIREKFYPFKSREKRDTLYQDIMNTWNKPALEATFKPPDSEQGY